MNENQIVVVLLAALVCFGLTATSHAADERINGKPNLEVEKKTDDGVLLRWNYLAFTVRIKPPVMTVKQGQKEIPVSLRLQSHSLQQNKGILQYQIFVDNEKGKVAGRYTAEIELLDSGSCLRQTSQLVFTEELNLDLGVTSSFDVVDRAAVAMVAENMESINDVSGVGTVIYTRGAKAFALEEGRQTGAYFHLGINSTDRIGPMLSMPVVGFALKPSAARQPPWMLAVSSDPYSGTQFYGVSGGGTTHISMATRYCGTTVPLKEEARTSALEFHRKGADGMFQSFYRTIPELAPAPAWVHEIALAYFDYNGDNGKGWYNDIEKMAEKCPEKHRGKIAVCIHGWYDNTGLYCYDHSTGMLLDKWQAFANPVGGNRKPAIPMSKQEMHQRIKFAKDRGFRVILYYADCTNCTGVPDVHKGQAFVYENGKTRGGWKGPCGGGGPSLDPTSKDVRDWYLGYLEALIKEYGREIDGFVFDETNYFLVNDVSYRIRSKPEYADRAMMTLMRDLTLKVQQWRKVNPGLVMLEGSHYFYGLVANGSFTDYAGLPLAINYRNASWTCSWENPGIRNVHTHFRTDPNTKYPYGLDLGLSNGYGSDTGPSEMSPKVLDEVFKHFLNRVNEGPERPKIKTIEGLDKLSTTEKRKEEQP